MRFECADHGGRWSKRTPNRTCLICARVTSLACARRVTPLGQTRRDPHGNWLFFWSKSGPNGCPRGQGRGTERCGPCFWEGREKNFKNYFFIFVNFCAGVKKMRRGEHCAKKMGRTWSICRLERLFKAKTPREGGSGRVWAGQSAVDRVFARVGPLLKNFDFFQKISGGRKKFWSARKNLKILHFLTF